MLGILPYVFQPILDALFARNIPFTLRWRMLLLQPLTLLTITLIKLPHLFSSPYTAISIPTRQGTSLRTLLYIPKRRTPSKLSPLHISFHAGAFVGGFPEAQAGFSKLVVEKTGAVVVAPHYRYAPKHVFPAAIQDAEDVVNWCLENCERLWGADPQLVTVDGFSAGGNLALAVCNDMRIAEVVKASATFYAPVGLLL
jgi:acetyl esterase/lipase